MSRVTGYASDSVRFADVEEALSDRERLEWLLPVVGGGGGEDGVRRNQALVEGISQGLSGRHLVDFARGLCDGPSP